ncbi:MAG: hypothetical protein JWM27_3689 [Gemmatimonadetes bacterium]|nr:hypothetical protein [Gemmatimonadota bacterium]
MRVLALAMIPISLAACSATVKPNGGVAVRGMHVETEWKANLVGTGPAAGLTGDAHAVTDGGKSEVTLNLAHGTAGRAYPWHVHSGACGSGGPVVGPAAAYPHAAIGRDGKSTASAHLNFPLRRDASYYVNIHASSSQMGNIVACAPLTR